MAEHSRIHLRTGFPGLGRAGVSAVEFALVAPVLLMILIGTLQCGIAFNNYLTLNNSVRAGARVLAASRGSTTPYSDTQNALYQSAPNLTRGSITISISVNGSTCRSDSACQTALTAAAGQPASVNATYPCNLTIMGVSYAPGCTLAAATTERVE